MKPILHNLNMNTGWTLKLCVLFQTRKEGYWTCRSNGIIPKGENNG